MNIIQEVQIFTQCNIFVHWLGYIALCFSGAPLRAVQEHSVPCAGGNHNDPS